MAEHVYEGMFILDSNRYGRDPGAAAGAISSAVEKLGGTMLVNRLWEERRLAYPINGQRKGTYWLCYFKLDSQQITTLNREYSLNELIMRSLVLSVDKRIVDTLVTHAQAGPTDANRIRRPEPSYGTGARRRPDVVIEEPEEGLNN